MRRSFLLLAALLVPFAAFAQAPVPIADAKALANGTVVTVAGRVTVAGEFGGPSYFQDDTGGMPVFFNAFTAAVAEGDSVVVTGPLSEFGATTGQPGTGLKQISGAGITFTVVPGARRIVAPRVVRLADLDEALEGQLVTVDGVRFTAAGSFQANTSYDLTDGAATAQVFIDNTTDLVNAAIPVGPFRIVATVGQFRGTRQLQPRRVADVGAQPFVYPGESVPRARTFEIATWNIQFFGQGTPFGTDPDPGPNDDTLQVRNAAKVLRALDADLYGLQEIVSANAFRMLLDTLNAGRPGAFRGFIAPIRAVRSGENPNEVGQKTAFVYRAATVDSVSTGFVTTAVRWAACCGEGSGRYPYGFTFDARVEGSTRRITAVVIHAKASSSLEDYNQRVADAAALKAAMDARPTEAFVLVGDYNDDVDVSTVGGRRSPYADFVDDAANYRVISKTLSERRFSSTGGGEMIDHLMISSELFADYFEGTVRIENPNYIPSYAATTSDHFPVWARFDLARVTANEADVVPGALVLAVYPNPARGQLTVRTAVAGAVVELFDVLGRSVARVAAEAPGEVAVPVAGLGAGAYVVRVTSGGRSEARVVVVG